jgi:hypothetical protein
LDFPVAGQQGGQSNMDKSDDLVKVLRELTIVHNMKINLQGQLQGRKLIN